MITGRDVKMNELKEPLQEGPGDAELLRQFQNGDDKAFEKLIKKYEERLFNTILGMLRNHHEAEDVYQDMLLKVYRKLPGFRGESGLFTWLYRVSVNTTWDHLRKRKRRPAISLDAAIEEKRINPMKLAAKGDGPGGEAGWRDIGEKVTQALEGLSPKYRVILQLKEEDGLSYEEIAKVLGCSIGTVESRLFRARAKLKKKLEPFLK